MSVTFKAENLQKHRPLADKIKESLVGEGSAIRETENRQAYFASLPEEYTREQVEGIAKYNNDFVAATHVAIPEIAAEMFAANAELNRIDAEVGFFGKHDSVEVTVHREKTYLNQYAKDEADKTVTKHLVMNTSVNTAGYGLKSIKNAISEEYKESLAKK